MLYTLDSIRTTLKRSGYRLTAESATGLPFEVVFESVGKSRVRKFVDRAYFALVKLWPRMFAYQFVLEVQINTTDSVDPIK
jgi:hypothetical protein